MENKYPLVVVICLVLLLILIIINNHISHNEQQMNNEGLIVPRITELYFSKNQINQMVNIRNPDDNNYLIQYSIIMDDGYFLYQSDLIYPGHKISNIVLRKPLNSGVYSVKIAIEYFSIIEKESMYEDIFDCQLEVR